MQELEGLKKIYQDYLEKISSINATRIKELLEIDPNKSSIVVPVYGFDHEINHGCITNELGYNPSYFLGVILCKYVLKLPEIKPQGDDWVTYKDFHDSRPFVEAFKNYVENPIAKYFTGRPSALKTASDKLNGYPINLGVSSDLTVLFHALPQLPVLMLFNDQDEELPSTCSILFERRAAIYLDMECLAMLGMILLEWLRLGDPGFNFEINMN